MTTPLVTSTTRIILALTLSAVAALAIVPLASCDAKPAPAKVQKCTQVLAPGQSC